MSDSLTVAGLQAQLAERDQEIARLRSELAALNAEECDQIAERLRRSEEQARELIRYAPSGIYEIDIRTRRFRGVNDALCTILGYTRDELLTLSPFDLLAEESRAVSADRLRPTLAGETLDSAVEYHVRTRGGRLLYAILSTRITYVDGQPDTAFVIAHDVTEHRRVEEELREQRAWLGRLAAELETILAAIADGLIVYDREGRIVRRNAAAEHMLGYSSAQRDMPVQERSAAVLRPLHPDGTLFATEDYPVNPGAAR